MKLSMYPYQAGSRSSKALKEALGIKAINVKSDSKFKGNQSKVVINWGNSRMSEEALKCKVINRPEAVAIAANKLDFFNRVRGAVSIPEYTTNIDEALAWIEQGKTVLARETLVGNSGNGIHILSSIEDWEDYEHSNSKMYVQYIPKKDEFRVHVSGGEVIDVQRKALRSDNRGEGVNWKVRNLENGFVFVREGVEPDQKVLDQAIAAVVNIGLDFGAADVIWNCHRKEAYVLEVNTAPGLEGSTVDSYKDSLTKMAEGIFDAPPMPRLEPIEDVIARVERDNQMRRAAVEFEPRWVANAIDDIEGEEF